MDNLEYIKGKRWVVEIVDDHMGKHYTRFTTEKTARKFAGHHNTFAGREAKKIDTKPTDIK